MLRACQQLPSVVVVHAAGCDKQDSLMRGGQCGKLHGRPSQGLITLQQLSTRQPDIRRDRDFVYPSCIRRFRQGGPHRNIATTFGTNEQLCCRKEAAQCFMSVSSQLHQYKTSSAVFYCQLGRLQIYHCVQLNAVLLSLRNVETSCHKHFVVVSRHQQTPPLTTSDKCHNLCVQYFNEKQTDLCYNKIK